MQSTGAKMMEMQEDGLLSYIERMRNGFAAQKEILEMINPE